MIAAAIAVALVSTALAEADQSVLTYHGALDRTGRYVVPGLTYERARGLHLDASFHPAFQGHVYAQPLFWRRPGSGAGMLIVVTEEDEVYALDAQSGAQIWKRALGGPVPGPALPCGNISPLGVTGAPVIDAPRATIYLDAAVMRANEPRHEIYALSLADGSVEPGWPVDV
jgi:outer membrane protein assembly factor BamB